MCWKPALCSKRLKCYKTWDFFFEKCTFAVLDEDTIKECDPFSCGHQDLDDFFHNDAPLYNAQLLGKLLFSFR